MPQAPPSAQRRRQSTNSNEWGDSVGGTLGLLVWRIESMRPVRIAPEAHGDFHVGDAYIILSTHLKRKGSQAKARGRSLKPNADA